MKLSIITVNFNNLEGLKRTADSVLSQTWRNFEWLIIDGGSSDGSREYIDQLFHDLSQQKESQNPISYWCSEKDGGVYNAMNKGIEKANGEYLNFMNSGDIFYGNNTLELVFKDDQSADILFGDWKRIIHGREEHMHFPSPVDIYSFFKENICHQAMFIRRDYHLKHFYDESYRILADYKNWAKASLDGASFSFIPQNICIVTIDGISSKLDKAQLQEFERLKNEVWPEPVRLSLERLEYELESPYQMRVRTLMGKGGLPRLLTRFWLKMLSLVFNVA